MLMFTLTVPALESSRAPSVFPLASCCKDATAASVLVLGCLVTDFFPEPVAVTWDRDVLKDSVVTFPTSLHSSGLYTTVSQLQVPGSEASRTFTCSVAHGASPPSNRTFSACHEDVSGPTVKLFHSSCNPSGDTSTPIQLLCLIRGIPTDQINVTWLVDEQESSSITPYVAPLKQEDGLSSTYSEVNITQGHWVSESTYTCRVTYEDHIFEDHARKCSDPEPRGVRIYLSPPSPLDLYVLNSPKLTCLVVDLAQADGMKLSWLQGNRTPTEKAVELRKRHYNGTLSVTSTLPVLTQDWVEGETYQCMLEHPDLPRKIVRSLTKARGQRAAPEVYVFQPPDEGEASADKVTLTCLVQNFFPADISVLWLRNNVPVGAEHQTTTEPQRTSSPRPRFFVFSRLEVARRDWERGSTFSCRAVHEALPQPRTRDQSLSKAQELVLQDMCVDAAESLELAGLWNSLLTFITLFMLSVGYGAAVTLCKVHWALMAGAQEPPPRTSHNYSNVPWPAA